MNKEEKQKKVNPYELLELDRSANEEEIKKAYKKLSMKYHPDRNMETEEKKRMAEEIFKDINAAYQLLTDEKTRSNFDEENDDDDTPLKNVAGYLFSGKKLSEMWKEQMKEWIKEYATIKLHNNLETEINKYIEKLKKTLQYNPIIVNNRLCCNICDEEYETQDKHMELSLSHYKNYLDKYQIPDINEYIKTIFGEEVYKWKPIIIDENYTKYFLISDNWSKISSISKLLLDIMGSTYDISSLIKIRETKLDKDLSNLIDLKYDLEINRWDVKDIIHTNDNKNVNGTFIWLYSLFKAESALREKEKIVRITGVEKYFNDKSIIEIFVKDPPKWIPDNEQKVCSVCCESFSLFKRRHHCRLCGNLHCYDCQHYSSDLDIGYIYPVKCCSSCNNRIFNNRVVYWFDQIESLISKQIYNDIEICLIILSCYSLNSKLKQRLRNIGNSLLEKKQYKLASISFQFCDLKLDDWILLLKKLAEWKEYNVLFTYIIRISYIFSKSPSYWLTLIDSSHNIIDIILQIVYYIYNKISFDQIFLKLETKLLSLEKSSRYTDIITILCLSGSSLSSDQLFNLGNYYLNKSIHIALYFYISAKLSLQKWIEISNKIQVTNPSKTDLTNLKLILLIIDKLHNPSWKSIKFSNKFTKLFSDLLFNIHDVTPDFLISEIISLFSNSNLHISDLISLVSVLVYLSKKPDPLVSSWDKRSIFLLQENKYKESFICYILSNLSGNNQLLLSQYGEKLLEIEPKISFSCFAKSITKDNTNWFKLGDHFFSIKRYSTALSCYSYISDQVKRKEHIMLQIKQLIQLKNYPKVYLYCLQVFSDVKYQTNIIEILSDIVPKSKLLPFIVSFLKKQTDKFNVKYNKLHYCLCEILEQNTENSLIVNGILHHVAKYDKTNSCKNKCIKIRQYLNINKGMIFMNNLRDLAYKSKGLEMVNLLNKMDKDTRKLAENFYIEQVGKRNITDLPLNYRCIMYLLAACISLYDSDWSNTLYNLQQSLLCYPIGDIPEAVAEVFKNNNLQRAIYKNYMEKMSKLVTLSLEDSFFEIKLSEDFEYQQLLKNSPSITQIRKFESAVKKYITDPSEAGFLYLDLSSTVQDPSGSIGCYLVAINYFLKSEKLSDNLAMKYAYRNLIQQLVTSIHVLSYRYLVPEMQLYCIKWSIIILYHANRHLSPFCYKNPIFSNSFSSQSLDIISTPLIDSHQDTLFTILFNSMSHLSRLIPILNFTLSYSCDTLLLDLASRQLTKYHLENMSIKGNELCPKHVADYYLFEGEWKNWFPDYSSDIDSNPNSLSEHEKFQKARLLAMNSLLSHKKWSLRDVERTLEWQPLQRTSDGWLSTSSTKQSLSFLTKSYKKVEGIQFNKNTGELSFLFQDSTYNDGLFTMDDVHNILVLGVTSSFFTLNQPDNIFHCHPFQEMKYAPTGLAHTDYLSTLLHTDYLLKMISMGVEVSSISPFEIKDASDGFMKRLPSYLRELLKPVSSRKESNFSPSVHRFWIEAGELLYDINESDDFIIYRLGNVNMSVRTHLMIRDEHGNLIDAPTTDPDSPEEEFAQSFTKYYDQIGYYFPELLRLRELLKLGALSAIVSQTYHNFHKIANSFSIDRNVVSKMLSSLKSQIHYPLYTESNVSDRLQQTLDLNGVSRYQVSTSELHRVESSIRSNLRQIDESTLEQICDILSQQFHTNSSISSQVHKWLSSSQYDLITLLINSQLHYQRSHFRLIPNEIDRLGYSTSLSQSFDLKDDGECVWVPAAFYNPKSDIRSYKVYGGVNLGLNLQQGNLNQSSGGSNSYRIYSARELVRSRNEPSPHHNFPRMYDNSIMSGNPTVVSPNYHLYSQSGSLNGRSGSYEIGVRPHTTSQGNRVEVITHRFFRPDHK